MSATKTKSMRKRFWIVEFFVNKIETHNVLIFREISWRNDNEPGQIIKNSKTGPNDIEIFNLKGSILQVSVPFTRFSVLFLPQWLRKLLPPMLKADIQNNCYRRKKRNKSFTTIALLKSLYIQSFYYGSRCKHKHTSCEDERQMAFLPNMRETLDCKFSKLQ